MRWSKSLFAAKPSVRQRYCPAERRTVVESGESRSLAGGGVAPLTTGPGASGRSVMTGASSSTPSSLGPTLSRNEQRRLAQLRCTGTSVAVEQRGGSKPRSLGALGGGIANRDRLQAGGPNSRPVRAVASSPRGGEPLKPTAVDPAIRARAARRESPSTTTRERKGGRSRCASPPRAGSRAASIGGCRRSVLTPRTAMP